VVALKSKRNYKEIKAGKKYKLRFRHSPNLQQQMTMTSHPLHAVEFVSPIKRLYHTSLVLKPCSKRCTNARKQSTHILTSFQSLQRNGNKQENPQNEVAESHDREREIGNEQITELAEELQSSDDYYCCVECSENDYIMTQSSKLTGYSV
jgi:hypothetical protein